MHIYDLRAQKISHDKLHGSLIIAITSIIICKFCEAAMLFHSVQKNYGPCVSGISLVPTSQVLASIIFIILTEGN